MSTNDPDWNPLTGPLSPGDRGPEGGARAAAEVRARLADSTQTAGPAIPPTVGGGWRPVTEDGPATGVRVLAAWFVDGVIVAAALASRRGAADWIEHCPAQDEVRD